MRSLLHLLLFNLLLFATCSIASAQILIRCDSIEFTPRLPVNAFEKGTKLTIRSRVIVKGLQKDQILFIQFRVNRDHQPIVLLRDTIIVTPPTDTVWLTYTSPELDTVTRDAGRYEVQFFAGETPGLALASGNVKGFVVRADHDIAPVRVVQPLPGTVGEGDSVPVVVRYYNLGTSVERDINVGVKIYPAVPGYSESAVIAGELAPMEYRDITFRTYVASVPGPVELWAHSTLPGDSITENDYMQRSPLIRVVRKVDIAVAPLAGSLHLPVPGSRHWFTDSIPMRMEIRKIGTGAASDVLVNLEIVERGYGNGYIHVARVDLSDVQSMTIDIPAYKALRPDILTVRAYVRGYDRAPENDTLSWTFRVAQPIGVAVADPADGYSEPAPDAKLRLGYPAHVRLAIRHSNPVSFSVPITLQIRNSADSVVYDQSIITDYISGYDTLSIQDFPINFVPREIGRYCVTAWVNHEDDTIRTDDMARWCFDVIRTSSVDSWQSDAGYSLVVLPNPVRDDAVLRYRVPEGVRWRSVLYDAVGREVRELCGDQTGGEGELNVSLDGVASGLYTIVLESSKGERIVAPVVVRR